MGKRVALVVLMVALVTGLAFAVADVTVAKPGSIHLTSGTTDYEVNFGTSADASNVRFKNLSVAPSTADIVIRFNPTYGGANESITIRAGDTMSWDGLENLRGFVVDRSGATVVDAYWW